MPHFPKPVLHSLCIQVLNSAGYPRHRENRENRENGPKNSLSGKTQGIWKFCQKTGNFVKTQWIYFAHVVNALILKVKDIAIFAATKNLFFSRSWIGLPSQFCVCNSQNYVNWHRENTGNLKIQFEWVICLCAQADFSRVLQKIDIASNPHYKPRLIIGSGDTFLGGCTL